MWLDVPIVMYINHTGVCRPKRVWFLGLFGLKRGIHFALFGLAGIGCGFPRNYGRVWTYLSFQFQISKKKKKKKKPREKHANLKWL